MNVRFMQPIDVEAVYEIECESFSVPWSRESLSEQLTNSIATYLVVEEEKEVIGYGGFLNILGEAEVTNIAIKKAWRRQGRGRILFKALLEYAKESNATSMMLEVRESNEQAIGLYTSFGFSEIARRKNYYQKPKEDAIVMQMQL